jgi:hypothetical protein
MHRQVGLRPIDTKLSGSDGVSRVSGNRLWPRALEGVKKSVLTLFVAAGFSPAPFISGTCPTKGGGLTTFHITDFEVAARPAPARLQSSGAMASEGRLWTCSCYLPLA